MDGWLLTPADAARVAAATAAFYVSMLVMLRLAGRRTLAQLSAFDVVITIAMGSLLASMAVGPPSAYLRALTALGVLLGFQLAIGAMRRRWDWVRRFSDFPSEEIGRDGRLDLPSGVLRAQMTEEEVRSRLRQKGGVPARGGSIDPVGTRWPGGRFSDARPTALSPMHSRWWDDAPHVVAVHDERMAEALSGHIPLVLSDRPVPLYEVTA